MRLPERGERGLYIGWTLTYLLVLLYILSAWLWPEVTGFIVRCPLRTLTGWSCPTCGLTRACLEMLQGNFDAAVRLNPLVIPAVVAAVAFPVILLADVLVPLRLLPRICLWRRAERSRDIPRK